MSQYTSTQRVVGAGREGTPAMFPDIGKFPALKVGVVYTGLF